MQNSQGATYLQLHKAAVCFSDISEIVRSRVAFVPRQQIMVQMYAAMKTMGMSPSDLLAMNDHMHMFEFIKASLAAAMMDGKQTPYYSDYVIQSVQLVENAAIALADLQPVPGSIEYEQGCSACFYKQHTNGKWYRYHPFIHLSRVHYLTAHLLCVQAQQPHSPLHDLCFVFWVAALMHVYKEAAAIHDFDAHPSTFKF